MAAAAEEEVGVEVEEEAAAGEEAVEEAAVGEEEGAKTRAPAQLRQCSPAERRRRRRRQCGAEART